MTVEAIEVLKREHALHRRMLTLLERMARAIDAGTAFPSADVADVLGYFREFVETYHHAKEDRALYPLTLGFGDDDAVEMVGRLVADHQETRDLMHSLTLFWEPGDLRDDERRGFAGLARAYASRMRRHMELEETRLFPRVEATIGDELDQAIADAVKPYAGRRDFAAWQLVAAVLEERWPG